MTKKECIVLYNRNLETRRILERIDTKLEGGYISLNKLREITTLFRLNELLAREGSEYFNVLCK